MAFVVGERVRVGGKSGEVAYVGPAHFAKGVWVGVILALPGRSVLSLNGSLLQRAWQREGAMASCRAAPTSRASPITGSL